MQRFPLLLSQVNIRILEHAVSHTVSIRYRVPVRPENIPSNPITHIVVFGVCLILYDSE